MQNYGEAKDGQRSKGYCDGIQDHDRDEPPVHCARYEAKETDTSVFLFLELMSGGELFDKIIEMGSFTESMAADISYKLLGALNYMHKKGIIHRDLKPENMLLARKGDLSAVKLTDFGLSKMIDQQSQIMKTACGTPGYVAPEILTLKGGGYDHQVDVWSMGVIIYVLLCGFLPSTPTTTRSSTRRSRRANTASSSRIGTRSQRARRTLSDGCLWSTRSSARVLTSC